MAQTIENMKANYMNVDTISTRIKADGLKEYLEFKNTGEYQFLSCENCDGPILGHITTKCRHGESYDEKTIAKFESWLKRIPELRKQIEERAIFEADRQAKTQAEIMSRVMRDAAATAEPRNTTQLVKARWPSGWSGQRFDKWQIEIEKWSQNNKSTEEDKFMDLIEISRRMRRLKTSYQSL